MEKLNLRMVANAFSNKQNVVFQDMERDLTKICEIVELRCDEATITDGELLYDVSFNQIQLVVRPLSDLTKEIEVNGEKFVPMIRLLYLYETNYFHENENLKCVTFNLDTIISCEHKKYFYLNQENFIVKYLVATENLGTLTYSFTYDPELRRFAFRDDTRKMALGVGHQLDLFEKLFEWQFDVYALIEKGYAIDVNTLNK